MTNRFIDPHRSQAALEGEPDGPKRLALKTALGELEQKIALRLRRSKGTPSFGRRVGSARAATLRCHEVACALRFSDSVIRGRKPKSVHYEREHCTMVVLSATSTAT